DVGDHRNIVISVDDGNLSASLPAFSISVTMDNSAPTISGNPPPQVNVDNPYSFTPIASDPDGDDLTFTVSGLPGWASFNASNGSITGTPSDADVRTYNGISITVSDPSNVSTTLGPFSITVVANAVNSAPTISGNPPSQVNANSAYSFTPTANDADGDDLTFSESGLPGWASFNTSNGSITGTPSDANVDTYSNISITVSDTSNATATLGPFSITVNAVSLGSVTLDWTPPTQNDDGSELTDLDGYKIYWRTMPGSGDYPNSVTLENEGLTSYVVENLVPGTYEFVATSFNTARVESVYSNPATKVVN
ncbi:MAG: putative Ig domain-containing protein, partial [Gammaproteobacteria bacterium]|nr:putative Ig domain-containing protein [Gammaproteobacteria bacterium]